MKIKAYAFGMNAGVFLFFKYSQSELVGSVDTDSMGVELWVWADCSKKQEIPWASWSLEPQVGSRS